MADGIINFCNLKRQFEAYPQEFYGAVQAVFETAEFCDGSFAKAFEKDFSAYCGTRHASAVNSGTDALFLAMKALGITENDEVIMPANTFVATAWGAVYNGAVPVFCDCKADTWEIDPESLERSITKKTKAVVGVHLYGQPFDFDSVKKIADAHKLTLIEDCAQAHGALYKEHKVGSLGDAGCFSFYPTKNLGAFGDAGCVISDSKKLIDKIDLLKRHAADENGDHLQTGYNMRMDGIQAAVLSCKLKRLDENNQRRAEIAEIYKREINNPRIRFQSRENGCTHVYHLFVAAVDDREKFAAHMSERKIHCGVHYPVPCHRQRAFEKYASDKMNLPNSELLAAHCVSLPMFPELTEDEICRVIDACCSY